jgi:hypothetical protein
VVQDIPVQPIQQPLGFDLNESLEPLEDDLGLVDNIFQVLGDAPQLQPQIMDEDVIVASSDSEGAPEDIPQEAQVELNPVENPQNVQVFIPMDNGAPLQLLPDDIQEDELMD